MFYLLEPWVLDNNLTLVYIDKAMEVVAGPVRVSLIVVSSTETEKRLKLVLKYEKGDIRGNINIFRVRRWLSDPENGIWEQEEVILESVEDFSEKEYLLPKGVPGSDEYSLKVAFFDSLGIGHAVYPPEYDPSAPPEEETPTTD